MPSWVNPNNQAEIVESILGEAADPFHEYDTKVGGKKCIGLAPILSESPINESHLAVVMYNTIRTFPIVKEFGLTFGNYENIETVEESRSMKDLVGRTKAEICETLARQVCSDETIIDVHLDVYGNVKIIRLKESYRYDEGAIDNFEPYFTVRYLKQF